MAKKAGDNIPCPKCYGQGYLLDWGQNPYECPKCQGTGLVTIRKSGGGLFG